MPVISKEQIIPASLIGFNYLNSDKVNADTGIHMFLEDWQIERTWNLPDRYLERFKAARCVCTPDFSLYRSMPFTLKAWNVYRSRLLGQYWQQQGIHVIPTVSWADQDTFAFCFDGIEPGSLVAISTVGVRMHKAAHEYWKQGVTAMIEKIQPSAILIYGQPIDHDFQGIPVTYYKTDMRQRMDQRKEG